MAVSYADASPADPAVHVSDSDDGVAVSTGSSGQARTAAADDVGTGNSVTTSICLWDAELASPFLRRLAGAKFGG